MASFLLVDFNPFTPKVNPSIAHIMAKIMPSKNTSADPRSIPLPCQTITIYGSIALIIPNAKE